MNTTQRKYALARIDALQREAEARVKDKYTVPGVTLTNPEKMALILGGKVKLRSDVNQYTDLIYAFDFSKHEKPAKVDDKALAKARAKLFAEFNRARDELMLGDAEQALVAIRALEREWLS